jgi:hypothetical protein
METSETRKIPKRIILIDFLMAYHSFLKISPHFFNLSGEKFVAAGLSFDFFSGCAYLRTRGTIS